MQNLNEKNQLIPTGYNPQTSDPMKDMIRILTNVMRQDFKVAFAKQFPPDANGNHSGLGMWQKRLLSLCDGLAPGDLSDGYEEVIKIKPDFIPEIPQIIASAHKFKKIRLNDEKNNSEAERIALMPPKPEISESVARQNLDKIKEMLGSAFTGMDNPETEQERKERLVRLEEKRIAHEELIKKDFPMMGKQFIPPPSHECHVGYCRNVGTISSSTTGNGNFYCQEHYVRG